MAKSRKKKPVHTITLKLRLPMRYHQQMEWIQQQVIGLAMAVCKGNCEKAAQMLGMNRPTLVERRRALGLKMGKPNGAR